MGGCVLVTGASGGVGLAVARALSRRGDDVRELMRSASPHTKAFREHWRNTWRYPVQFDGQGVHGQDGSSRTY